MDLDLFDLHSKVEMQHWWFVGRRQIVQAIVEHLVPPSDAITVVDVGCGTGGNSQAFASSYSVVGIDPGQRAIDLAKASFPHIKFLQGYAPAGLGDVAATADVFLIMDVLEHIDDDFEALSSLIQRARAGSYFLITVPADMRLWSEHDVRFGHYRRYTPARLRRLWRDLPVEELLVSHFNSRLYPIVRGIRSLNRILEKVRPSRESDLKPGLSMVNRLLSRIFSGESARLIRAMDGQGDGYQFGVSLMAVLRRAPGQIAIQTRPSDVEADFGRPGRGAIE